MILGGKTSILLLNKHIIIPEVVLKFWERGFNTADRNTRLRGSANLEEKMNKVKMGHQKETFFWLENLIGLSESGKDENYQR